MPGFLIALSALLIVDQALKATLSAVLPDGRSVGSFIRLGPVRSARTFAGRAGLPPSAQVALWLVVAAGALFIVGVLDTQLSRVALGAAVGGAASNLIDLFVRGGVVDYVDLHVWPLFNLADAAIVLGVVIALVAR